MPDPWLSFVPHRLARELLARPTSDPLGREQRLHVVALFADVSGFTPISEALSKVGKVGAEELTAVLNSYFAPMIDLIESYGGIIGKFGGDAMTVYFPYHARSQAATARRALACALAMQAAMHQYAAIQTSAGVFGIAMRAGLAMGQLFCTSVGIDTGQLEYIIAGSVLDRCADAEHHAKVGEVIAHQDVCLAAGTVVVRETRGEYSCVERLRRAVRTAALASLGEVPEMSISTLARYVNPVVAQRIRAGQANFINEHRKVTILFVSFDGFEYDTDLAVGQKLQAYLAQVMQTILHYDGDLNKVDMGDKGSKYVVLFGAPVAHENDEERAIRCALDLIALGIPARIGVNTGFVYCGLVGSARRQEYTVMGDPVNLAARLMQASVPGQVLVSGLTQRPVADLFAWDVLPPISVKGKSQPIAVFTVQAALAHTRLMLSEPRYALPMIGRSAELQTAQAVLEQAIVGQGQILAIIAEAGMGKSRLAAELVVVARWLGYTCYGGAAQSYGTATPYLLWKSIWQGCYGLDPAWPTEIQAQVLAARLEELDPNLVLRMPLLGVLLNLPLPDNELTDAFEPQQRTELLKSLLLTSLRLLAQAGPLLFVLEDSHWIDPLSRDLFEYLGRNLVDLPVCFLVVCRPDDTSAELLAWAERLEIMTKIQLTELAAEEAEELIQLKLDQRFGEGTQIPRPLFEQIVLHADGNPFYLEEMINYLSDRGINFHDPGAMVALELPDSLHSLIISRIDQLAEAEKTTLKLASVIGRIFRAAWLWGSYPEIGEPTHVQNHLHRLSQLDFTPLDKPAPDLEYLFKHITTLEVAYDSLALATRTLLHEQIGLFIEQTYADSQQYLDILAFHYGRSRNLEKQRIFFRRAGDAARAAYANDAAIIYFERLLPLLDVLERTAVLCDLGQVLQLIGRWADAETHYRDALQLAEGANDRQLQARCQLLLGYLMWCKTEYPAALDWLAQAQHGFEQVGDRHGVGQTIGRLGLVYDLQGDYPRAIACFEQQAQIARELGDLEGQAQALGHVGSVYQERGEYERALVSYQQQLEIATTTNNRRELVFVIGNIGMVEQNRGHFRQALTNLAQALRLAAEIGDQQAVEVAAINMGEVYRVQGESEAAFACYQFALAIAVDLNDRIGITATVANMAQIYADIGESAHARHLFDLAIQLASVLNIPYFLAHFLASKADLEVQEERYQEAAAINQEAAQFAEQIELGELILKAKLLTITIQVQVGMLNPAEAVAQLTMLAEHWLEDHEQALIAFHIWQQSQQESYRDTAAEFYQAGYAQSPRAAYRQKYQQLTGILLPDPPPLPPLPTLITTTIPLEPILARVEALL